VEKIKVVSLCTGVGGFELGMDDRFEIVAVAEIDKYCNSVLKYRFEETKNYGDITKRSEPLPDCDLIVAGTPCQDLSIAGHRKGLSGERSGLFHTFIQAIKEKRPNHFIWENVKGATNSQDGWDLAEVQIEMAEAGYDIRFELLSANEFGVPQSRERIVIVGCLRGEGEQKVLSKTRYYRKNAPRKKGNSKNATLLAYSKSTRAEHIDHRMRVNEDANTLSTGEGCRNMSTMNFVSYSRAGVDKEMDEAYSLNASDWRGLNRNQRQNAVMETKDEEIMIRRLTPREGERLMGWPDDWTKWGIDEAGKKVEISDTQRYKMIGNGVVSNMIKSIIDGIYS
jgi:DNA (cytosine-5)-methyltransferase 1